MRQLTFIFFLFFFFLSFQQLRATHIVGADLVYECINPNTNLYRLELTMYRDCTPASMADFDDNISIFVFNSDNGNIFQTLVVQKPFTTPEIIPADWDVCTGQVYSLCVEYGTYVTTVTLPPRVGGYDIGWSRCCRNNAVTNIQSGPGPTSQGITVVAHVPSIDVPGCNSMPQFRQLAPLFLCAGQPFSFDHSAIDPDGDSLVYVISNPFTGTNTQGLGTTSQNPTVNFNNQMGPPPYRNVNYLGGYSFVNPFASGNFQIDPQSGLLSLTPTQTGLFVFAISVLEYRNGILMSENKRDFQINVVQCQPQGNPPIIGSDLSGVPSASNDTIYVQPLESFCYDLSLRDPSPQDTVILFPVSAAFGIGGTLTPPFATLTQTGINPVSGQVCWTPGCEYAGRTIPIIVGGQDTSDCRGYNIVFDTTWVVIGGANPPVINHTIAGGGNSLTVDVGESFCYTYTATDEDPRNGLVVTPIRGPFSNLGGSPPFASFTANGVNPVNGQICWTPSCEYAGQTVPFVLRVVDTNYCDVSFPRQDVVNVTINPLPVVSTPDTIEACQGSIATLTTSSSGPVTYTWSPSAGLSDPFSANPSVRALSPTDYTITFRDTFGCDQADTVHLKPLPLPQAAVTADQDICVGDAAFLIASGGVRYRWSPATGLSSTVSASVTARPTTTTTYQVIVTGQNGCEDTVFTTITVNPLPIVDAGNDTVKCGNQGVMLSASGGVGFAWTPSDGLSDPSSATPIANPDSSTRYFVAITDTNGCTSVDSVFVRAFYANAGPDFEICIGDTSQLMASGGVAYLWDPDPSLVNPGLPNATIFPLDTNDYYVTVTDTSGCTDRDSVQVIVNPLPVTSVTNPDPYVCSGGPTVLTATGGANYLWTPGGTLDDSTSATPVARPINLGPNIVDSAFYFVTVTDSNGCVNYDSIGLEVRIRPEIFVANDTFVCPGDTVPIWLDGGFGVVNQYWRAHPTLLDSTLDTTLVFPSQSTYYYGVVEAVWGCDNTDSVLVYVINPDAGPDTTICFRDTIQLQGSGGVLYQWAPGTGLSNPTIPDPLASPPTTTTYTLVVTDSVGCVDSAEMTITVLPLPPADAGEDFAICVFDTVQLQASGGVGYQWNPGTGLSADSIPDPLAFPSTTTSYILTVTDTNSCSKNDTLLISVNPLPIVDAGEDTTICRKTPAFLRATGAQDYAWTPVVNLSDPLGANPLATPDSSIRYFVTGTDANGCRNRDSVFVSVIQLAEASGSPNDSICKFQLTDLEVSGNASNYLWSTGETNLQITVDPKTTTRYWVVPFNEEGCAGDTVFIDVYVEENLPRARLEPEVKEGFYALEVPFDNQSQFADRFIWRFGDGATSREVNPIHTYRAPGLYAITLVADNSLGCPDSTVYEFVDVWEEEIFFPNAFSPNADGRNDEFFIPNGGFSRLEIRIFNRWGQEVFFSADPNFRWDGTFKGQSVPEGVYVFRVVGTTFGDQRVERAGTITLIR
jgi:gliding motility-associated-like protein